MLKTLGKRLAIVLGIPLVLLLLAVCFSLVMGVVWPGVLIVTIENRSSKALAGGSVTGELFDIIADLPRVEPSGKRALVVRGARYGSYGHVVIKNNGRPASVVPFWPPEFGDTTEVWVIAQGESLCAPLVRELGHGWTANRWRAVADTVAKP